METLQRPQSNEEKVRRQDKLSDIDLSNTTNIRLLLQAWYHLQEAKYEHLGVCVVVSEIKTRYYSCELTDKHRSAIRWYLVEDKTQQEAGKIMNVSSSFVVRLVEEGLRLMAEYDIKKLSVA